jgi:hypothetical protein
MRPFPGPEEIRCDKDEHLPGDLHHRGVIRDYAYPGSETVLSWQAGDRREFTGEWPGACPHQPCSLPAGHYGRDAP